MHSGRWKRPWLDPGTGQEGTFFMFWFQLMGTMLFLAAEGLPWEGGTRGSVLCPSVELTHSELISSVFTWLFNPELLGLLPPCPPRSEQLWVFVFHNFGFFGPNKLNFENERGKKEDPEVQNQLKIAFL